MICEPLVKPTCRQHEVVLLKRHERNAVSKLAEANIAFQKFKDHYYADIVLVAILIITNGLAIAAALGMNTNEETTDSKARATREMRRKDSDASNLKSLFQMKNPAASARDSTFMYENI